MRAAKITLSLIAALVALATFTAEQNSVSRTTLEGHLRRWGLIDAARLSALGYANLWNSKPEDAGEALHTYRETLIADVASPYRWCDLGEAFLECGRVLEARYCLSRAVVQGPLAPPILIRAANSYFRMAELRPALRCTAQLLAIVPTYDDVIFATYRRMGISIDEVLVEGLPTSEPRAAMSFFRHLLAAGSLDDAQKLWMWLSQHGFATDQLANEYAALLVKAHRYQAGIRMWTAHIGARDIGNGISNCLFNGGFEHAPFGSVFDWQIEQLPNASAELDTTIASSGLTSLRIRFAGKENTAYSHVRQTVLLYPGLYRLQCRVRTSSISTDEGIVFRVHDAENGRILSATKPSLVGSTDWRLVKADVDIKPPARLFVVEIVRERSLRFDSAISGTAWIDDFYLKPARGGGQACGAATE